MSPKREHHRKDKGKGIARPVASQQNPASASIAAIQPPIASSGAPPAATQRDGSIRSTGSRQSIRDHLKAIQRTPARSIAGSVAANRGHLGYGGPLSSA